MAEELSQSGSEKYLVAGLITCGEFQKCRFVVTKLHACFPNFYEVPEVRPMMDVQWKAFLNKVRAKYGGGTWTIQKPVLVFLNNEFLGDDVGLIRYITKKYRFPIQKDWFAIGRCHLRDHLRSIMDKFRQLAYLTISINHQVVGTLLFELYNDLVPLTCENFLSKCKSGISGYVGTPIQRIMKNSWLQCGGWNIPESHMRCENYVVPHDRRGVLSMCNNGRHKDNSVQYFITLAPTPWMDYRYVAFGQLIQGEEILAKIENIPTEYESPTLSILVVKSGELVFDNVPDFTTHEEFKQLQKDGPSALLKNIEKSNDIASKDTIFSISEFKKGIYALKSDMRSYFPCTLSQYLLEKVIPENVSDHETMTASEDSEPCTCKPFDDYLEPLYQSPNSSDVTL